MIYNLIKNLCEDLEKCNIPYMISGSIALNVYTIPGMTIDIDMDYVKKWCADLELNTYKIFNNE